MYYFCGGFVGSYHEVSAVASTNVDNYYDEISMAASTGMDDPLIIQSNGVPIMETLEIDGTTFYLVFNEEQLRAIRTSEYALEVFSYE